MPRIATAIKALTGAIEKEEIPTFEELAEITRLVAELTATVVPDEDDSSSGEDVSSVECDTDEESSDEESSDEEEDCCSESSERRPYKKGKRAKGYALYIKNGGTRASWAEKSDKYKDNYYERKNGK
jgi:Ran GTPase-activating protein (RanGAP) involved in mRNA processing and transport